MHGDNRHSREGPQGGSIPAPSPPVLDPVSLLPHLFFGCAGQPKLWRQPPWCLGEIFCCWLPGGARWGEGFRGCPPASKEGLGFLFLQIPQAEPSCTRACCGAVPAGLRPLPGRACVPLISPAHPLLSTPPERGRDLIFSIVPSVSITPPRPFSAARPSPRPPLLLVADAGSRAGGQTKSSPPCPYPRGGSSPSLPFPRGLVPLPKSPSPCPPPQACSNASCHRVPLWQSCTRRRPRSAVV